MKLRACIEKIRRYFHSRKKTAQAVPESPALEQALSSNPYLQSKVLWNDLYGSLQVKLENSYRLLFILALVLAMAMIGFVIIAGQSRVQPYVTVIHGNELLTLDPVTTNELNALQPKLAFLFAEQFIDDSRTISADTQVNNLNHINAYAFVSGAAVGSLKQYFDTRGVAANQTQFVRITSVLRRSKHTLQVRWQEHTQSILSGGVGSTHHYLAELHYQFGTPSSDTRILRVNPFGFYITQLSWSEELTV